MRCPTASRTRATQEPYNVVRLMAGVHRPIVLPPWRRARTRQGVARCVASCERRTGRCRPLPACRQILCRPDPSPDRAGRAQGATHRHCRRAGCADRRCGPSRAGRRCTATRHVRLASEAIDVGRRAAPRSKVAAVASATTRIIALRGRGSPPPRSPAASPVLPLPRRCRPIVWRCRARRSCRTRHGPVLVLSE